MRFRKRKSEPWVLTPGQRREDADIDRIIEAAERAAIPCDDCQIGEPHACERAWWEQRYDHLRGAECADPECLCHPATCHACGQPITRATVLAASGADA